MKHYAAQIDLFVPMIDTEVNGAVLRDHGITQVLSHNQEWRAACLAAFDRWLLPPTFTGESLRFHWEELGLYPTHPNAWGGLINFMQRRGLIIPTGQWAPMADKRSHARKTPLYRRP